MDPSQQAPQQAQEMAQQAAAQAGQQAHEESMRAHQAFLEQQMAEVQRRHTAQPASNPVSVLLVLLIALVLLVVAITLFQSTGVPR
jgi:hypothetical protein